MLRPHMHSFFGVSRSRKTKNLSRWIVEASYLQLLDLFQSLFHTPYGDNTENHPDHRGKGRLSQTIIPHHQPLIVATKKEIPLLQTRV